MLRAILRWIFLGVIYLFLALVVARGLDINLFWDANIANLITLAPLIISVVFVVADDETANDD